MELDSFVKRLSAFPGLEIRPHNLIWVWWVLQIFYGAIKYGFQRVLTGELWTLVLHLYCTQFDILDSLRCLLGELIKVPQLPEANSATKGHPETPSSRNKKKCFLDLFPLFHI